MTAKVCDNKMSYQISLPQPNKGHSLPWHSQSPSKQEEEDN